MIEKVDDPLWWGKTGTKEVLEVLLMQVQYKYAKKDYLSDVTVYNLYYGNVPIGFDIEDSSFYDGKNEKVSVMYVWQFAFNGYVFMGREWSEFIELVNVLKHELARLNDDVNEYRLIIYVHFLDHEFQFMRKKFKWNEVFARASRSPIYAVTEGIEFRDSYILTGKSLAKVAEDLREGDFKKMVGDLDYTQIRGTKTPLKKKEIGYCMADVLILNELIAEKIEDEGGNIGKIPLTNTGYVRRYTRKKCMPTDTKHKKENAEYFSFIHELNMTVDEYDLLRHAFQGGFTHANFWYVSETLEGRIDSIDFTSSYPAQILSKKYPMSRGQRVTKNINNKDIFELYLKSFCCVFTVQFIDIIQKPEVWDGIISRSKCTDISGEKINNGRVYQASTLTTVVTEVDFDCIRKFYNYKEYHIGEFYIYKKDYLPKPIIESVLEFYKAKTTLKGVEGQETEYMIKKEMLNSIYGMMVTSPLKELVPFDTETGDWTDPELMGYNEFKEWEEKELEKYNDNKRRFLFYPWGVYITAYARQALYTGLLEMGKDYIYSDTDSIKCLNLDRHMDYIQRYDDFIVSHIDETLKHYDIDPEESRPCNIKGQKKQIGVWDIETEKDPYIRFKTLGAKRYMYEQSDGIHITIAGVSKELGKEFIAGKDKPFDFFTDEMEIDEDASGKLTHTYLDSPQDGVLQDYLGNVMEYHEDSSVYLEKSSYSMSITEEFKNFYTTIRTESVFI